MYSSLIFIHVEDILYHISLILCFLLAGNSLAQKCSQAQPKMENTKKRKSVDVSSPLYDLFLF